jgi:hypothetical protein
MIFEVQVSCFPANEFVHWSTVRPHGNGMDDDDVAYRGSSGNGSS